MKKKRRKRLGSCISRIRSEKEEHTYANFLIGRYEAYCKKGIYVKDCNELDPALIAAIKEGPEALIQYLQKS